MSDYRLEDFLCQGEISIVEAMQRISQNCRGILFIVDDEKHLLGSLTDGDIRRWLVETGDLKAKISRVMFKSPTYILDSDREKANEIMKRKVITALPVLSIDKTITSIVFAAENLIIDKKKSHDLKGVPVIIMAGGMGTRLHPYTKILPKPLIPIGDVPIIERIINSFCGYNVTDFYIPVNYKKGMIKSYFNDLKPDYSITYVEEEKPLGTAGSLRLINKLFDCPVFVTNCDILIHADYEDIYKYHKKSGNKLTIVSALKKITVPYGVLNTGKNGVIQSIEEKPSLSYFVNTGMYILEPDVLSQIPENTFFHMTDLATLLMNSNQQVGMYPISEDDFLDMGELEEMSRMEKKLALNENSGF